MFESDFMQLVSYVYGMLLLMLSMVKFDEYELWEDMIEIKFQGKFRREC